MTSPNAPPADRAAILQECRQLFLDRIVAQVRAAGVSEEGGLAAVRSGAGEFFDAMASAQGRSGFEQAKGLTASRITLISDDDLTIAIKLGELSRHLQSAAEDSLWKLSQRLALLLGREALSIDDNPLGPEAVCAGLAAMCSALHCNAATAANLLDGVGRRLGSELPLVYAAVNELLIRRNVHPPRRSRSGRGDATTSGASDPVANLQQAVARRAGPAGAAPVSAAAAAPVNPAAAAMAAAAFNHLIAALQSQQNMDAASGDLFGDGGGAPVAAASLRAIRSGSLAPLLSPQQAPTLDALEMLFDGACADRNLPDPIKIALGRLQIPVLKAALLDRSFFSDPDHPARDLLDEIGRCAVGVDPGAGPDHPVCRRVEAAVAAVRAEFARDAEVFSRQAAALESFVAQSEHDLRAAVEPYIPLALAQEKSDLAELRARQVAGELEPSGPVPLQQFLREDWPRLLAAVHADEGEDSPAWRDACRLGSDLLRSVQAQSGSEDRQQLAAAIPALLRRLREALARIGVPPADRQRLFDACFEWQTAVLRGKPLPAAISVPAAAAPARPEMSTRSADGRRLIVLDGEAGADAVLPDDIHVGRWLRLQLPDGATRTGCVTWISPDLHLLLLANPDWSDALLIAPAALRRQLQAGTAASADRESLFDTAAKNALRGLSSAPART